MSPNGRKPGHIYALEEICQPRHLSTQKFFNPEICPPSNLSSKKYQNTGYCVVSTLHTFPEYWINLNTKLIMYEIYKMAPSSIQS